jgi:long-chain acyl-CoA synthetase
LIRGLQERAGAAAAGGPQKQSWNQILSAEALAQDREMQPRFAGKAMDLFRFVLAKILHFVFRLFLRIEAVGLENLPHEGPFMLCPNHVSYLDPLMVLVPLPWRFLRRVFFVGAADFFAYSWMRLLARVANIFPVDPDAHLLRAMKIGAWGLRRGRILCIFPEGGRSFDDRLMVFKKGAAILGREIDVPVIPVAIRGAFEVWPRDSRRIRFHKVRVIFGAPLQFTGEQEGRTDQADTARLRQALSRLIESNPA